MEATSIDGLVAHCQGGRFTGILRVRAREGIGEVWFLSGMTDEMTFGVSAGDEALDRMRKATEATYELVARLPHPAGGFKKRFPSKGSIATATPVTLMRYCEQYALTCTLAVESHEVLVEVKYELGELVSVETTANDDGITAMLEAHEGTYEFTLPRVDLPAGTPVLPPAPSLAESMPPPSIPPPGSLGFRALLEAKPPVGRPASDEAAVKRKTVEIARQQKSAAASPKPAKTTPTPTTPSPSPAATAGPKAKPKAVAVPRVERKREEKPPKAPEPVAAPAAPPPEPVKAAPTPAPAPAPEKEETKPAEAKPEEPKPAAAGVEEEEEEREDEPEALAKRSPPPAKRSPLTWVVVTLLLAVLGYFWWTTSKL